MSSMTDNPRVLGNRYEVGDLLGRGGMAEVHLGRDTRLGRVVAIKLLRTDLARDPVFQARFRREAQAAASLNHPSIVSVYDSGEESVAESGGSLVALPYIVMEYVEGRTLRELLRAGQHLDPRVALEVTSGVLAALDNSHRAGIVHRDIKPANVMLTPNGEVKVMDFGIARALADSSSTMTLTQAVIGTAQYLSPEQARGETVDARSDLYSTGCMLFELVTGRPPFMADSPVSVAYQHVREPAPHPSEFNAGISPDLDRVILHALAKDRETRYQTASEFRNDLENLLRGRQVLAPAPTADPAAATVAIPGGPAAQFAATESYQPMGGYEPTSAYDSLAQTALAADPGHRVDRQPARRSGNTGRYAMLGVAAVLVVALVAVLAYQLVGGTKPAKVHLDDLTGTTYTRASAALVKAGLKVEKKEAPDDKRPDGYVIGQDPKAPVDVDKGSTVVLTVSTGSGSVPVTDVQGKGQEEARLLLEADGLVVGNVQTVDDPSQPANHVVKTDPAVGKVVAKKTTVTLIVSSGQVKVPDLVGKTLAEATKLLTDRHITPVINMVPSDKPVNQVVRQDLPKDTLVPNNNSQVNIDVSMGPQATPTPTDAATPTPTDGGSPSPTP
jgi:eukaryotic-like serine/threonine-protein kinase